MRNLPIMIVFAFASFVFAHDGHGSAQQEITHALLDHGGFAVMILALVVAGFVGARIPSRVASTRRNKN